VDLRVLGPLEVRHEGAAVALPGTKPRELLALLALRPNRPVSARVLSEELWEGAAPPTAASALRVHIGRVRQVLEPEKPEGRSSRLTLDGPGYTLHLSTDELDTLRFEASLGRGREASRAGDVAAAERHLAAALQGWRGPALVDVHHLAAAQPEIARLEQLRLSAVGEFADANLALGQHQAIVDMLFAEVRRFPLDESLIARHMLALYRGGRQAEALRAFSTFQQQLDDELGTGPSAELRQLETDILLQSECLAFVDRSGPIRTLAERRPQSTRLIGRRSQLTELLALHDEPSGGTRLVLVSGVAGIGKTTLVAEYCRHAQRVGAVVFTGRCDTDADQYQPIIEILDALEPSLEEPARARAAQLVEFLRNGSAFPASEPCEPDAGRVRMLHEIAAVFGAVRERPLVLVVEDLHWADHATLRVLRHVLRHADLDELIVVGTHRSDELGGHQAQVIDRLAPPTRTQHHRLDGFDDHEVRAFVRVITEPRVAAQLVDVSTTLRDVSGGNPFHIAALARELDESLLLSPDRDQLDRTIKGLTPVGVSDLISRRVARLTEQARAVVDAAAVIGHDISLELLTQTCAVPPGPVMEAIDELLDHDLLTEAADRVGAFEFPHALARNAIYESIPPVERIRLHARVGEILETRRSTGDPVAVAELARHFLAAAPVADEVKGATYAEHAGREASERLALDEAADWYERALECPALPFGARGRVHLALARAYAGVQRYSDARDACFNGAVHAREAGDHALLADLAIAATGSWASGFDSGADTRTLLEEALRMLGEADPARRLRLLIRLATGLHYTDAEGQAVLAQEAHAIAEALSDDNARAEARLARHLWLTHEPAARQERLSLAQDAVELLGASGSSQLMLRVGRELLADLLENGDNPRFDREIVGYEQLAAEVSSPRDIYWSAVMRASQATMRGDLVAGEQLARGAALRGDELQQRATGTEFLQRFLIRLQQGRLSELVGLMRGAHDPGSAYRSGSAVVATAFAEAGRIDEALKLARWSMGSGGDEISRDSFWLAAHALLADVAAAARDEPLAARLRELIAPCEDHIVVYGAGAAVLGPAHYWLGLLDDTCADYDGAVDHLIEAERVSEQLGLPYWRAQAQIDLASAFTRRGRGDEARIRSLTDDAVATAEKSGFGRILVRAR
jgi:DNA-binding SARP family transcriptional activator